MKRILITGASGLLGLNLALQSSKDSQVFGTVYSHNLVNVPFHVMRSDLKDERELKACLADAKPDLVINCAALANLEACESDPQSAEIMNAILPEWLAAHTKEKAVKLLHISTDAVFDGQIGNYSEEDHTNPLSVYARTKLQGEQAVAGINPQALIVRVNFYGYSLLGRRSLAEFFLYNLAAGTRVFGFSDVFFCPLLAQDLGVVLMEMVKQNLSGLYHVVSPQALSKYDFGVRIARLFGLNEGLVESASVAKGGLKARRSPNLTLNVDKLKRDLSLPLPDQEAGLQKFKQLFDAGYPDQLKSYLPENEKQFI